MKQRTAQPGVATINTEALRHLQKTPDKEIQRDLNQLLLEAAIIEKEREVLEAAARRESYRKRAKKAIATRRANQLKKMYHERALKAAATRRANKEAAEKAALKEKYRQRALKAAATRKKNAAKKPKVGKPRCCCNIRGCKIGPFTGQIDYD